MVSVPPKPAYVRILALWWPGVGKIVPTNLVCCGINVDALSGETRRRNAAPERAVIALGTNQLRCTDENQCAQTKAGGRCCTKDTW
jgi:hypothetical protein